MRSVHQCKSRVIKDLEYNLKILCKKCHDEVHGYENRVEEYRSAKLTDKQVHEILELLVKRK